MDYLELSLTSPAENLACDDALLEWCAGHPGRAVLRFWEPQSVFVVLGHGNRAALEINLEACRSANVPVLRRCSGGGAVVQGPGCLNYALVVPIASRPEYLHVPTTNKYVLGQNQEALGAALGRPFVVAGTSDLALNGRKVSGNAQRRTRSHLLFHGTFLLDMDLAWMDRLLPLPSRQPDYRRGRSHADFLTNLRVPGTQIRAALCRAWGALAPLGDPPYASITRLARERYASADWTWKL